MFSEQVVEDSGESSSIEGSTFRRVVTLIVHVDNVEKQIQVNIPDNLNCDLKIENAKLKQDLKLQMEELRSHRGPFDLMDADRKPVTIEKLHHYFSDSEEDLKIKDPFEAAAQPKAPFELWVFKQQFTPNNRTTALLIGLLECIGSYSVPSDEPLDSAGLISIRESIETMITLLSTHLYYQKSQGASEYDNFKYSPLLDIMVRINPEKALSVIDTLLHISIDFKDTTPVTPGRMSKTFRFFVPAAKTFETLENKIKQELPLKS